MGSSSKKRKQKLREAQMSQEPQKFLITLTDVKSDDPQPVVMKEDVQEGTQLLTENIALCIPYHLPHAYPCFGCNKAIDFTDKKFERRCKSCGIPICSDSCEQNPAHKNYECEIIAREFKMKYIQSDIKKMIADVTVMRFIKNVNCEQSAYQEVFFDLILSERVLKYRRSEEFKMISEKPREFLRMSIKSLKDIQIALDIYSIIRPNIHSFSFHFSEKKPPQQVSIFSLALASIKQENNGGLVYQLTPEIIGNEFTEHYTIQLILKANAKSVKGQIVSLKSCTCLSCCDRQPHLPRTLERYPKAKWAPIEHLAFVGKVIQIASEESPLSPVNSDGDFELLKMQNEDPFKFMNLPLKLTEPNLSIDNIDTETRTCVGIAKFLKDKKGGEDRRNFKEEAIWGEKLSQVKELERRFAEQPGPMDQEITDDFQTLSKMERYINDLHTVVDSAEAQLGKSKQTLVGQKKLGVMMHQASVVAERAIGHIAEGKLGLKKGGSSSKKARTMSPPPPMLQMLPIQPLDEEEPMEIDEPEEEIPDNSNLDRCLDKNANLDPNENECENLTETKFDPKNYVQMLKQAAILAEKTLQNITKEKFGLDKGQQKPKIVPLSEKSLNGQDENSLLNGFHF